MCFEIHSVCLQGEGLKFVASGSDDTRRQSMKSTFISIPEEVLFVILENFKYLSQYAFICLCNDFPASSDS